MSLEAKDDLEKLKALSAKPYKEQAIWFLNGYWNEIFKNDEKELENVYAWVKIHEEICPKKKKGCELNEFDAHRFLEMIGETLTVKDMRAFLRSVDIDFNKMVSLTEYLVSKYKVKWRELIHKPQDDAKAMEERKAAQDAVDLAQQRTDEATRAHKAAAERELIANHEKKEAIAKAKAAKEKEIESTKAEAEAKTAADASKKAFEESAAAAEEQKAALEKVLAEEKKYKDKLAKLERESKDTSLGQVKRMKAANMLAQSKSKPTLALQTAKVTLTASEKRAAKAAQKAKTAADKSAAAAQRAAEALQEAKNAREISEAAEKQAIESAKRAEDARKAAEEAVVAAQEAFAQAEAELKKLLAKPVGSGQGSRWWLQREFEDMKKYMPKSKLKKIMKQKKQEAA
mmetsp:Transcript_8512/g.11705  ORF Transcript_8512/g.11705 Transcript_8512/m.11705 type:complete len:401 (-) Transcript_8512:146-1348(-)